MYARTLAWKHLVHETVLALSLTASLAVLQCKRAFISVGTSAILLASCLLAEKTGLRMLRSQVRSCVGVWACFSG
jgi:hypothetical protein